MSRSVSFLRRITFKSPSSYTPIWIKQADLYEDENRIYAFLTFANKEKSPIERVKIRITPFDEGKYGMDSFGIQILNLDLKPGLSKEHRDPLILPKGTYGFNFSVVSYGFKKKALDVDAPGVTVASPAQSESVAPTSGTTPETPEANASAPAAPNAPTPKNPNLVKPLAKMPSFLLPVLILLGLAAGFLLFMSGVWGKSLNF